MVYVYAPMVSESLPEFSLDFLAKVIPKDILSSDQKMLEYSIYVSARNEMYRDMCIIILDALSREPYNFGRKRLETVMGELAKNYIDIQTAPLSEYESKVKTHVGIVMED
jgi:hypothetical protein